MSSNKAKEISEERKGELFMGMEILLWAAFPVFVRSSQNSIPPLMFAAFSTLIAGIVSLMWLWKKGKVRELFNKEALPFMIPAAILISIIFFPAVIIFGQKIASGDTALLLQGEVLFIFLVFGLAGLEQISFLRIIGAILIVLGAIIIILKDFTGEFNIWDLSIFLITIVSPLANFFQKKIVKIIDPLTQIVFRNLLGGILFLAIAFIFEDFDSENIFSLKALFLISATGIFIHFIRANLFLEAIKRIDVSKAIALNGAMPAVALVLGYFFLDEDINLQQIISFILVFFGVLLLTRKEKEKAIL